MKRELIKGFQSPTQYFDNRLKINKRIEKGEDLLEWMSARHIDCEQWGWSEKETIASIVTNLPPFIYAKVSKRQYDSLDDLRFKLKAVRKELRDQSARRPERQGSPPRAEPKPSNKAGIICYNCNKPGHRAAECRGPKRNSVLKGNQDKRGDQETSQKIRMLPEKSTAKASKVDIDNYPPLMMQLFLDGQPVQAELDSGAVFTCVDAGFYRNTLKRDIDPESTWEFKVVGANNEELKVVANPTLEFQYQDDQGRARSLQQRVVIVQGLISKILVGRDFITTAGLILDVKN